MKHGSLVGIIGHFRKVYCKSNVEERLKKLKLFIKSKRASAINCGCP